MGELALTQEFFAKRTALTARKRKQGKLPRIDAMNAVTPYVRKSLRLQANNESSGLHGGSSHKQCIDPPKYPVVLTPTKVTINSGRSRPLDIKPVSLTTAVKLALPQLDVQVRELETIIELVKKHTDNSSTAIGKLYLHHRFLLTLVAGLRQAQ